MSDNNKICLDRLRALIDQSGTAQSVADGIGVDRTLVTKHYNGNRTVTIDSLIRYAQYFNVSTDYLLGLTDTPTTDKDVRFICDYMGLSEEAVEKIRKLCFTGNSDVFSLLNPEQDFIDDLNKKTQIAVNHFLLSDVFRRTIEGIRSIDDLNRDTICCLSLMFKDSDNFIRLNSGTCNFIQNAKHYLATYDVADALSDLQEVHDLITFRVQRDVTSYLTNYPTVLSQINGSDTLRGAFDLVYYYVWDAVNKAHEKGDSIAEFEKVLSEHEEEHKEENDEDIAQLKKLYEKVKDDAEKKE